MKGAFGLGTWRPGCIKIRVKGWGHAAMLLCVRSAHPIFRLAECTFYCWTAPFTLPHAALLCEDAGVFKSNERCIVRILKQEMPVRMVLTLRDKTTARRGCFSPNVD